MEQILLNEPLLFQVDLFAGIGGVSLGTDRAVLDGIKVCETIAAVNHNAKAIRSHWRNHKHVIHFEEDIRSMANHLEGLVTLVNAYRRLWPNAKVVLWASPACTHFSKAKGGGRKRSDMRTLAWSLCKQYDHKTRKFYVGDSYIQLLNPDYVHIENVEEFLTWGPLTTDGKIQKDKKGKYFNQWCRYIQKIGYDMDWKRINAADLGAYTKRTRLFGCFAKHGLPIAWPPSTHSKHGDMFTNKWLPVKEVLDFNDEGKSIFPTPGGRKKYMSLKTYERVLPGCVKFIPKDPLRGQFLLKYNSTNQKTGIYIPPSIEDPAPTISTQGRICVVTPVAFMMKYHGNHGDGPAINSIDEPTHALGTRDQIAKVQPVWIDRQYSGGGKLNGIEDPIGTIPGVPKANLVTASFIDQQYGQSKPISVEAPVGALTGKPKNSLIQTQAFIISPHYNNNAVSVDEPMLTVTGDKHHHMLVKTWWSEKVLTLDLPPHVIQLESGHYAIEVYESDPPIVVKIKEFMATHGLVDIRMRMLRIPELKKIQGFPVEYFLEGTQEDQKLFIGNAVHPNVPEHWYVAKAKELRQLKAA